MTSGKLTSRQYFRSLNLVHFGLLAGQVVFAAAVLIVHSGLPSRPDDYLTKILLILVSAVVINGFVTGNILYNRQLKRIRTTGDLIAKMTNFRGAMIVRLALLEGASLFAVVASLITGELLFLTMTGLIIAYFLTLKPSPGRVISDLDLDETERRKVEDPNEIIATYKTNSP